MDGGTGRGRQRLQLGRWPRFDRYEVREGYIRPARGAALRWYDPWTGHEPSRAHSKRTPTGYPALLRLARECRLKPNRPQRPGTIRPHFGPRYALTAETEESLCHWCSENGLLGLLLERTLSVTLPYRWKRVPGLREKLSEAVFREQTRDGHLIESYQLSRGPEGWRSRSLHPLVAEFQGGFEPGSAIPEEEVPADFPRPGAITHTESDSGYPRYMWEIKPVGETLGPFFPDVAEHERELHGYPSPGTDEFWRAYAEPVEEFFRAASQFDQALAILQGLEAKARITSDERDDILDAMSTLEDLSGQLSLEVSKNWTLRQRWSTHSLLGAYATMAIQDLSAQVLHACDECGHLFVSTAHQARFCSDLCRRRVDMRKYRKRLKAKKRRRTRSARPRP